MILPVAHIHTYIYIVLYYTVGWGYKLTIWRHFLYVYQDERRVSPTIFFGASPGPFGIVSNDHLLWVGYVYIYIYIYMLNDAKSLYQRVLWCKTLKWWRWWRLQVGRLPAKSCYLFHFITRFHHCHCSDSRKTCLIMVHRISLLNAQKYKVLPAKLVYNSND